MIDLNDAVGKASQYASEFVDLSNALQADIEVLVKEIQKHRAIYQSARNEAKIEEDNLSDRKKSVEEERQRLFKDIKALRDEVAALKLDVHDLVSKKIDLKKENNRLSKQNEDFKSYEVRAWKLLKAKDDNLQQREKSLREMEQVSPVNHSFLPPTS